MQVIFNYDRSYRTSLPSAIALGTFDGIHLGHRQLINELLIKKKKYGYQTIVYTFLNHPLEVLKPETAPQQIMLVKEKIKEFSNLGIDILVLNLFDDCFLHQTPNEFLDQLTDNFNIRSIIVGFNFRFGYKGAGDREFLDKEAKLRGLDLVCVPPVEKDGQLISSTLIRNKITHGYVEEASVLLSKPYSISGTIVHGHGRGRKLGFPTANIKYSAKKVLPKPGVYLTQCWLRHEGFYWGVTSIGSNPTFSGNSMNIESYLLNCHQDLYGKSMKVYFLSFLREEKAFDTAEGLKRQISRDVKLAKKLIYKYR
ncbi:MAG TPA: bifunctional riboflavin kinase/FAD synthetase [Clostridiales bacterium]|nr:bifunctional riboflavin kinase/FAD synthetase [Clostridiales bacterium]